MTDMMAGPVKARMRGGLTAAVSTPLTKKVFELEAALRETEIRVGSIANRVAFPRTEFDEIQKNPLQDHIVSSLDECARILEKIQGHLDHIDSSL